VRDFLKQWDADAHRAAIRLGNVGHIDFAVINPIERLGRDGLISRARERHDAIFHNDNLEVAPLTTDQLSAERIRRQAASGTLTP